MCPTIHNRSNVWMDVSRHLHPKVHGGLLGVRGNPQHEEEMAENGIEKIDMTILNLYPFEATVQEWCFLFEQCIENIDIGGPSMLRTTAKNHAFTTIVTSPKSICTSTRRNGQNWVEPPLNCAKHLQPSLCTFCGIRFRHCHVVCRLGTWRRGSSRHSARSINRNFHSSMDAILIRNQPKFCLAMVSPLPFEVINGVPGYINLLDAANAWQLVVELKQATGLAAASSFKHVSPAGAAVAVPLTDVECQAYEITPEAAAKLTPTALAYLRARNADPMCSFGDFCAVSDEVDEDTALILKKEVSDGIIAPGYTEAALEIFKKKKGGKFIILQATPDYDAGELEYREVYGMTFSQKRNTVVITKEHMENVVTAKRT